MQFPCKLCIKVIYYLTENTFLLHYKDQQIYAEFLLVWHVALRLRSTDIANKRLRRRMLFGEVVAVECMNHKNTRMHCAGKIHSFQMSQHLANVTNTMSDSVQCGNIVSCSWPEASCHEDLGLGRVEV